MRILILDEDELSLFLTKVTVTPEFEAVGFRSLAACLPWARLNRFDILLVSFALHNESFPIEVMDGIRALNREGIRCVINAIYVDDRRERRLLSAGYEKVFLKPLSTVELMHYFMPCDSAKR